MTDGVLPAGLYEALISGATEAAIDQVDPALVDISRADPAEVHVPLARHVSRLVARAVQDMPEADRIAVGVELANRIAALCVGNADLARNLVASGAPELREIRRRDLTIRSTPRPTIPLSTNAILVNGTKEPRLGHEIAREIESAERVDLLLAFLFWRGVRLVQDQLADLVRRGGEVRVLTTTYAGATEQRAIDALADIGADVRVSYDTGATRLHAKAWLFERGTGFSTAYIGSSNLSRSAQVDGLEWNVRLAEAESPSLLERFRTVFETYWQSEQFEPYVPHDFAVAVARERSPADTAIDLALHVHPYPHQQRILDDLDVERLRHDRWRNLVVAATGTGKTVVAALDYRRLRDQWAPEGLRNPSLLFVAHREEILRQSSTTFRHALSDGSFGELFVGGVRPETWRHVFASIQSLTRTDLDRIPPDHYDVVIVDEFHHAEAPTYRRLLEHLKPRVLLGLTATPERTDGRSVVDWFDGRIASELRLWDAIEGGMLCPFQYFGVHDEVDLAGLRWRRGGYEVADLEHVYTGNDARAAKVVASVNRIVGEPQTMRALGFCVSVAHAHFMARYFNDRGIASVAIDASTPRDERRAALADLQRGELRVVFAVDLFNEGVDVPAIDTVLFLRPTESATVFLQQLGRGLRRVEGKPCLTVLDFIGNQHQQFRFDLRYRALTGASRGELIKQAEDGFPFLPSGCHIELDRVASSIVLENVRRQLTRSKRELVRDLQAMGDVSLPTFLERADVELNDLYAGSTHIGWAALRRQADLPAPLVGPAELDLARGVGRLLHVSDPERIEAWQDWLTAPSPPDPVALAERERRLLAMLLGVLERKGATRSADGAAAIARLWQHPAIRDELASVLEVLEEQAAEVPLPLGVPDSDVPLHVHCRYTRLEILAALGRGLFTTTREWREGVLWDEPSGTDVFAFTLRKAERDFSPTTMYRDYAISRDLIHWESQSTLGAGAPTAQRYIHHAQRGTSVVLFARQTKDDRSFLCLGRSTYVEHRGERPLAIVWRLDHPLPEAFFHEARAGAA